MDKAADEREVPKPASNETPMEEETPEQEIEKKEHIKVINNYFKVLAIEMSDVKKFLYSVQKKHIFVRINQFNHYSLNIGDHGAIAYFTENVSTVSRMYIDDRMKDIKLGEQVGCFVKPNEAPNA